MSYLLQNFIVFHDYLSYCVSWLSLPFKLVRLLSSQESWKHLVWRTTIFLLL